MFTNKCTEGTDSKIFGDKLCGATKAQDIHHSKGVRPNLKPLKTGKDRSVLANLFDRRSQK